MCGIVGAIARRDIVPVLIEGLKRLEYRGYDSCGVAALVGERLERLRRGGAGAGLAGVGGGGAGRAAYGRRRRRSVEAGGAEASGRRNRHLAYALGDAWRSRNAQC